MYYCLFQRRGNVARYIGMLRTHSVGLACKSLTNPLVVNSLAYSTILLFPRVMCTHEMMSLLTTAAQLAVPIIHFLGENSLGSRTVRQWLMRTYTVWQTQAPLGVSCIETDQLNGRRDPYHISLHLMIQHQTGRPERMQCAVPCPE